MKAVALLLLLAVVCCQAADWSWSSCGSGHYNVLSVTMTPDPPVVGQNLTFKTHGTLDESVSGGQLAVTVYWEGIDVKSVTENICSGVSCPIPKGVWDAGRPTLIPSVAPAGSYRTHSVLTDQNNQLLACLDFFFSLN